MKVKKWLLGLVTFAAMAVLCAVCAGAENYHAYIGFQTGAYSLRNSFDDATFGKDVADGKYFNSVIVWGGNNPETFPQYEDKFDDNMPDGGAGYVLPATYTDVQIDKDGTYKVGISDFDWALDGASSFNLLFVSTDIPFNKDAGEDGESIAKFSDCKIIVDGTVTSEVADPIIATEDGMMSGYTKVLFANIWNDVLMTEGYNGAYPTKSLEIQFDVSFTQNTDYEYSENSDGDTVSITKYIGSESDVVIPEEIDGKKVTSIGDWTFFDCSGLTSVTIPNSVTNISGVTFNGCTSLTAINVATGNQNYVSVNGVLYNKDKTSIMRYPAGKKDKNFKIPDCVTEIGWSAFEKCISLTSITIPSSVTKIGEYTFGYYYDNGYKKISNFKIYCYSGTASEQYAKDNGFEYELLDKPTLSKVTGVKLGGRAADALRINWTKNTSADGYIVEMYQGNKWVRVAKITKNNTTTFRKAGLKAGTAYKFRVRAYKMSGKTALYGNYSATVAARTNPSVVKGAKLTGRAADALRINWTKNTTADGYIVEMYKGGKWVRAAKITKNSTTTYRASGLKASTVYKFRVRAYKMSGKTALYGNYSATVTARTNPSAVKGVKIVGKAKDALRVNWTKNTSAQGYIVEMYKGGKWVRVAKITKNSTTTYRASGLKASTVYKFRVRAYKMSGKTALYGNYSATVAARTNPSVVKGVKIAGKAKDALRINWTKNASAQGYIVEMYKGGKWVRVAKITNNSTTTFRKAGLAKNTTYKFRVKAYYMSGKTALYGNYGSVSGKTSAK